MWIGTIQRPHQLIQKALGGSEILLTLLLMSEGNKTLLAHISSLPYTFTHTCTFFTEVITPLLQIWQCRRCYLDSCDMGQYRQQRIISAAASTSLCWWWSALAPVTEFLLAQSAGPELWGQRMNCLCFIFCMSTQQEASVAIHSL